MKYVRAEVSFVALKGVFCPYCGARYVAVPEKVGRESFIRLVVTEETAKRDEFCQKHLYCIHSGQIWFPLEGELSESEIEEIIEKEEMILTTTFHDWQ
jgi:hypothetical protein